MFCPKCGKEGDGLCMACYLELHPIAINESKIVGCSCGLYRYRGDWIKLEDIIEDLVMRDLLVPDEITIKGVEISYDLDDPDKQIPIRLDVKVIANYKGNTFNKVLKSDVRVVNEQCIICSRKSSGYFEAVLQFRALSKQGEFLDNLKPDFITKVETVRGGLDVYLTSFRYAKQVGRELRVKGFSMKETRKLHGVRKGREVYRTYLSAKI